MSMRTEVFEVVFYLGKRRFRKPPADFIPIGQPKVTIKSTIAAELIAANLLEDCIPI